MDARRDAIALRYHGGNGMIGRLDPVDGSMTWSTDHRSDEVVAGEFAVLDGVVVIRYESGGVQWLRVGDRTGRLREAELSLEEGLSAAELVIDRGEEVVRLRVDGDAAAASFARALLDARAGDAMTFAFDLALELEIDGIVQPTLFG
jgi:hypothetical protein